MVISTISFLHQPLGLGLRHSAPQSQVQASVLVLGGWGLTRYVTKIDLEYIEFSRQVLIGVKTGCYLREADTYAFMLDINGGIRVIILISDLSSRERVQTRRCKAGRVDPNQMRIEWCLAITGTTLSHSRAVRMSKPPVLPAIRYRVVALQPLFQPLIKAVLICFGKN